MTTTEHFHPTGRTNTSKSSIEGTLSIGNRCPRCVAADLVQRWPQEGCERPRKEVIKDEKNQLLRPARQLYLYNYQPKNLVDILAP
ncbi:hypothetical protein PROFUN_08161 [Planoprotostelium fungivorum]|uniref:Uncharacterized protein n=1 Tax=Planoprotostelium fungivorum TaxID=1890364 RepID=A0A2P6MQI9_9EUKA|nr:hypothetical protein PROFUN_08161 [Planoprotostelium fungivorum]